MNRASLLRSILVCVALAACDDSHERDGGPDGTDAGRDAGASSDGGPAMGFDETCGATTPARLLGGTTENIQIDTTGFANDVSSACGASTPGNDVFLAIDVEAGEFWHFHLATTSSSSRPSIFLLDGSSCDPRSCPHVSDVCEGAGDEHLAFVAESAGRWFIGIDDGNAGGGEYVLGAYRPTCGDDTEVHGEACDDGNLTGGDGCDRLCRVELSELMTAEVEPNDNHVEANALLLPGSSELAITGIIGGPGACTYPDIFVLAVPEGGDLDVDALNGDGSGCASSAVTPFYFSLEDSNGSVVQSRMTDVNGCAHISASDLTAGEYFVRVAIENELEIPASYRVRFRVTAP